ncbi:MAG TPA: nuclear transport factor 2 family protein [Terriglobia bacterium]|nr:nuclear transport factor 2 family protein [Terriglobia bacterium]
MNRLMLLLTLAVLGGFSLSARSAQALGFSESSAAPQGATTSTPAASGGQSAQPSNPPAGSQTPSSPPPCTPVPPPPPPASPESLEAGVRALLKKQVADWNRGDVTAFMRGYWKSPETEFVGTDGIMRGWQNVLDRYRKTYPDRASMGHLDFTNLEVTVLGPEAALAVGHWQLKRQNDTPGGVFTLVFRKFPEGWRIINDHTSQSP